MGSTVGTHYEVLEKVGEGAYGEVYKARDLHVPRFVALKFLYPHLLASEQAVARFRQEARAVSALSHPNVVVLHDFDTDPETGRLFLALEYLGGGTLRQVIQRSRNEGRSLHPFELLRCAIAMAAGLGHAHRHRIVHRDVKPSNVLFSEERIVKVSDFGLAKSDELSIVTDPGCAAGTVCYMSPEQARGMEVDPRTDIFSFGVVLYEMATGSLPFAGSSAYDVIHRIITEPTPSLLAAGGELPEELDRIVRRATAKAPSERYQDMEELETELLSVEHRVKTLSERSTAILQSPPRESRRRPSVVFAALIAMLLLAVSGALWLRASLRRAELPAQTARLMAVIPFRCLGAAESQRDFCEGLANTLSMKFTEMESLQNHVLVVPYSEIRSEGIASAGDAHRLFKVHLALTGSVEFVGEKVRVIVNLVDADKTVQIVSRKLDSTARSLVGLQDETSDLAGDMLKVRLTAANREQVNAGQTQSGAAFESFVRGLGHLGGSDIEDVRQATALLEQAVASDPSYAAAHAYLGEAYLRQYQNTEEGRWIDRARESCERALRIDSSLPAAHITMARVWLARTNSEKAIEAASRALSLEPKNAEALRTLGNAYADLARRDPARKQQAIDIFNQAIALRPELWTTYRDLGLAYHRMGDNQKAEEQFLRMLEFTKSADAYRRTGALYHLMGRPDDAISYLQKSLAVKPTPEAYANLGTVYYYLRRDADVVPNFEKALSLSEQIRTKNHVIWGNLAMAYMRTAGMEAKGQNAFREAIRIAEAKLETSPLHADTHASLAYYLVRVGDKTGALRHAGEALRLSPDVPSILFRCSLVYERLKRRDQALQTIRRAIERGHPLNEVLNAGDLAALRQDRRFQEFFQKGGG